MSKQFFIYTGGERDRHMAEELKHLLNLNHNNRIVHVGGHSHITDFKKYVPNLASFFPNSKRYFLYQADSLVSS